MSWITRLRNALNPRRLDDDLADEIRDHLARRAADLRSRGLSDRDAQRQAMRSFGNVTGIREQSRELRLWAGIEGACQDARYAWRGLLRNPVFALTAVVSLGLAIGANTAIYSIVDVALLRPLPVPQPDRLIALTTSGDDDAFSYPLYEQLRSAAGDSARLELFGSPNRVEAQASGADTPYEEVNWQFVSPDAFTMLGVPPVGPESQRRHHATRLGGRHHPERETARLHGRCLRLARSDSGGCRLIRIVELLSVQADQGDRNPRCPGRPTIADLRSCAEGSGRHDRRRNDRRTGWRARTDASHAVLIIWGPAHRSIGHRHGDGRAPGGRDRRRRPAGTPRRGNRPHGGVAARIAVLLKPIVRYNRMICKISEVDYVQHE